MPEGAGVGERVEGRRRRGGEGLTQCRPLLQTAALCSAAAAFVALARDPRRRRRAAAAAAEEDSALLGRAPYRL